MHLVDETGASAIDHGLSGKKFAEEKRTFRSVDPAEPRHDSVVGQNQLLGFAQEGSRLVSRLRRTGFVDHFAVFLRVNTRAAREKEGGVRKSVNQIARPRQIDAPIFLRAAAARAGAL